MRGGRPSGRRLAVARRPSVVSRRYSGRPPTALLVQVDGGPAGYSGRDLAEGHIELDVTEAQPAA
jgi:hypothetical protein